MSGEQLLHEQISELNAAVEELNFECEKLQILNTNLSFQLEEVNRELSQNIILLQHAHDQNERLLTELDKTKVNANRSKNLDNIIVNAHDYAKSLLDATKLTLDDSADKMTEKIYVNQVNDLLCKLNDELDKASNNINKN